MALFSGFVGDCPLERRRMATFEPEEFKKTMEKLEETAPMTYQFIVDYLNKEVTKEEVEVFCTWSDDERTAYLKKRYGGTV